MIASKTGSLLTITSKNFCWWGRYHPLMAPNGSQAGFRFSEFLLKLLNFIMNGLRLRIVVFGAHRGSISWIRGDVLILIPMMFVGKIPDRRDRDQAGGGCWTR